VPAPDSRPAPGRPDVVVVRLGPDCAGELLTLQRAAYVTQARLHADLDLPVLVEPLERVRARLADPAVTTIGLRLRDTGRLVGSVHVAGPAGGTAELGRLAVAPDVQGWGLGTRLVELAEAALPAGAQRMRLFTGEHSTSNLRLYERLGYVRTHRTPAPAGYDLVHLAKDLTALSTAAHVTPDDGTGRGTARTVEP
jgi:ribosomal protein S18 acetylase RimI-like enzyme